MLLTSSARCVPGRMNAKAKEGAFRLTYVESVIPGEFFSGRIGGERERSIFRESEASFED